MSRDSKVLIVGASLLMTLVLIVSIWFGAGLFFSRQGLGQNFLIQVFKGNEQAAFEYLSPELQRAVRLNCPEGRITSCADSFAPSEWGELVAIMFVRTDAERHTELFHTQWSALQGTISIVLQIEPVGDGDKVTNIWGFVPTGSTADDTALLSGEQRGRQVEMD